MGVWAWCWTCGVPSVGIPRSSWAENLLDAAIRRRAFPSARAPDRMIRRAIPLSYGWGRSALATSRANFPADGIGNGLTDPSEPCEEELTRRVMNVPQGDGLPVAFQTA